MVYSVDEILTVLVARIVLILISRLRSRLIRAMLKMSGSGQSSYGRFFRASRL